MPEVSIGLMEVENMPDLRVWAEYDSPETIVTSVRVVNPHTASCVLDFCPQLDESLGGDARGLGPAVFQWQVPATSDAKFIPVDGLRIMWSDVPHVEGHHNVYCQSVGFDLSTSVGEIFAVCHDVM